MTSVKTSILPVEDYSPIQSFDQISIATSSFPYHGGSFFTFIGYNLSVGSFPIILISITATHRINFGGVIDTQSPSGQINFMGSVIQGLTCSPMPEPVPIIMNKVILVRTSGRRTLP